MTPVALPLPSSDVQVTQVATGRTQKAAVTKNGRLFIWEVRICNIPQNCKIEFYDYCETHKLQVQKLLTVIPEHVYLSSSTTEGSAILV